MSEETIHGYNYKVRIWYPNAPENSTEGTILAAYEEDLAKQIQLQYPGVTYEVISKEPVMGNPGNPGADQNLRDRLIAEIYDNRMNAWKQGHVGIRPVSDDDLTELRGMSTQELEQTAKLTRQFLIPMVPGPRTEIERFEREEAGGFFTLIIYSDRTWDLYTPEGVAEGKFDAQGDSYEAKHQHPIIEEWINEKGREFFGPPSVTQPGETLYAIPLFITRVKDHLYYVLARDPGEALQKAKDDDYVGIWNIPSPDMPLPPSAYRWGTPIVATEGEKRQYLKK